MNLGHILIRKYKYLYKYVPHAKAKFGVLDRCATITFPIQKKKFLIQLQSYMQFMLGSIFLASYYSHGVSTTHQTITAVHVHVFVQ